jgi:hypothetical protein
MFLKGPSVTLETMNIASSRWFAVSLFLITVLTRLPFTGQYLYHWDSVNMAFGLRHFDVQAGAPQYPGYIVYVLLGQLVNAFIHDEQTSLVLISIVSSGLAAVAIYYLGREMFHPTTGVIAAAFLISSPLVWFYGEIALPHVLDLFGITFALWLFYRIMQGERRWLWFTAVFLALLGGIRQQDLLFLGPVIVFTLWQVGLRHIILFGMIGAAVSFMWFIPLVQNVGGLQSYLAGSSAYSETFFSTTSLLHGAGTAGLRRNLLSKLIPYALYAWSLALLPTFIYWGTQFPRRRCVWLKNRKVWFVILTIGPVLAFYTFVHMGQQGLVFVFMPMLLILSAEALRRLLPRPTYLRLTAAGIVLVNAGLFVLAPAAPFRANGPRLLTYDTLREHDRQLGDQISAVRSHFAPDDTVILSSEWRFMEYYLPEYALAQVETGGRWEADEGELTSVDFDRLTAEWLGADEADEWFIVIPNANVLPFVDASFEWLADEDGTEFAFLRLQAQESLIYEDGRFRVSDM